MNEKEFNAWIVHLCRQILAENPELVEQKVREAQNLNFTEVPMEISLECEMGIEENGALCWV